LSRTDKTGTGCIMSAVAFGYPLGRPLIDDDFLQDPYPVYRELREAGPIHWSEEFFGGAWLLTRHEDVEMMLRDPRFSARRTGGWVMGVAGEARRELRRFQALFARAMLFRDAPDHQRIRSVLAAAFHPEAIQRLAPDIEASVMELLDSVDAVRGFDFMHEVAHRLPSRVIARLMGIPGGEQARFAEWSDDLAEFIGAPRPSQDQAKRAQESLLAMSEFFRAFLSSDHAPKTGLLARLADAAENGEIVSGPELLAQCAMLLFAGYETTRNALGNGLYHLLSRPQLYDELRRAPHKLPGAVRELLRFDSPVQYTGRRIARDLVLHGQTLKRGQLMIGLIGSANRDPRRHDDPDRLDLSRRSPGFLSFGSGPHVCIGAALTLVEVETVFRHLLLRFPVLRLSHDQPRWNDNAVYRGLSALQVHSP